MSVQRFGRVKQAPHPLLFEILYEPDFASDREHVLPDLLAVDAAHVIMLARGGILAPEVASALLRMNAELTRRVEAGEPVLEPPAAHRGLYVLYEGEYIARLGPEIGGAAHVARSRNDINATIIRMRLRRALLRLLEETTALLHTGLALAERELETLMPAFTHMQPAQPSTFAHYLSGVLAALVRPARRLAGAYAELNCSPMGAGAGVGTSFPIDRELVAELLGFDGVVANSIDAVASRDYLTDILAALATSGVAITRLANDLQHWSSAAYGFVGWPDELVSTSSIMPQKRNAYVLENVRGEAVHPIGALMSTLVTMKSTPFTNSVETSAEATAHIWPAIAAAERALRLMTLLLGALETHPQRMRSLLSQGETTMTALADLLVRRAGVAFRTAHEIISRLVQDDTLPRPLAAPAVATRLQALLAEAGGDHSPPDTAEIEQALDPAACVRWARHGGGPAPEAVRAHLSELLGATDEVHRAAESARARLEQARARLRDAIQEQLTR